jgi:hypothetical protein
MKAVQTAEGLLVFSETDAAALCDGGDERRETLKPAAEAVTQAADPAIATAPVAKAAIRRGRNFQSFVTTH